jgi:hypothetical protein
MYDVRESYYMEDTTPDDSGILSFTYKILLYIRLLCPKYHEET